MFYLKKSGKYHTFKHIYSGNSEVDSLDIEYIITEDSKSSKDFMEYYFEEIDVLSAYGRSNVAETVHKYRGHNVLVMYDALSFGLLEEECRCEMEVGHPQLLHQAAYNTVEKFVEVDCDNDISQFITDKGISYSYRQMYWIGQTYALIHCRLKISSKKIIQVLPIQIMLDYYYTGHEMGEEVFIDKVRKRFEGV